MQLCDAIHGRISTRAFLPTAVPRDLLTDLLDTARWAPSGSNRQPWRVTVVQGAALTSWRTELLARVAAQPWDERRQQAFDERVRAGSLAELAALSPVSPFELLVVGSNRLYDAPVALVFSFGGHDGAHAPDAVPAFITTLLLAAHEQGLGTCWLGFVMAQPDLLRQYAQLPEGEQPVGVIALGYPDPNAAVNRFRSPREAVANFARWVE